MSDRYDVLVAGECYCDLIFSDLDATPSYGEEVVAGRLTTSPGGCYNMALGLTRLGLRTAWACDFGTDLFSRIVRNAAADDGIDPVAFRALDYPAAMVSVAFANRDDRGFITYRGAEIVPPPVDLLGRLQPKWLLQSFRHTPDWLRFIRATRESGVRVFGDCNGENVSLATPGVGEFIGLCDVFSPNESEAMRLTGARSAEAALPALVELCPAVLIKRGANGVIASIHGRVHEESAPAVEVVDTVGAGDAFAAGYLAAEIWGLGTTDKLRAAVASGTLSTTGSGSSATPTASELRAYLGRSFQPAARAGLG